MEIAYNCNIPYMEMVISVIKKSCDVKFESVRVELDVYVLCKYLIYNERLFLICYVGCMKVQ